MHIKNPQEFTDMVLKAVNKSKSRVVLGQGWVGLGNGYLQDDIFCVGDAHHATLFPKMAGIIHPGGSGTTHTSAKAGIPQFILPQLVDQYYWGHRIHQLGMGPKPMDPKRIMTSDLARAFRELTNDVFRKNTSEFAERMKYEDVVESALYIINERVMLA